MKFYGTKEAARMVGIDPSCLRVWEARYGWPMPTRTDSNYRQFTQVQVDALRRFEAAGRPFHQIEHGFWNEPAGPRAPTERVVVTASTAVPPRLVRALEQRQRWVIAYHLAALGRYRRTEREDIVACVRSVSERLGGAYDDLLRQYAQEAA